MNQRAETIVVIVVVIITCIFTYITGREQCKNEHKKLGAIEYNKGRDDMKQKLTEDISYRYMMVIGAPNDRLSQERMDCIIYAECDSINKHIK